MSKKWTNKEIKGSPLTLKVLAIENGNSYSFFLLKFLEKGNTKTPDLSCGNFADFSGQVYLIDDSDNAKMASRYDNGNYVGKLNPVTEKEAHSVNGRSKLSVDCYVEETQHWTDWYQYGYGYLGSTYEGSTFVEVCFEEGGSGDTGGTGGGGSGTTYREYTNRTAPDNFLSMAPEFKYPPDSDYEDLHPKLTEYLRNQIPNLAYNDHIINSILKYTSLSKDQIKEHLKWGQGPTIEIAQLDNACLLCDENTAGKFSVTTPNIIYLDIDRINALESLQIGTLMGDAFLFLIGSTLLNEYVHFGDNLDGIDYSGEEGVLFEIDAYGQSVNSSDYMKIFLINSKDY